jgi:hypothetical protein
MIIACAPDVLDRLPAMEALRGVAGWGNEVGAALVPGCASPPLPILVEVIKETVGKGGVPPTVRWAHDVLASDEAKEILAKLEDLGASVGRLLYACLLHRVAPSLFDGARAEHHVEGHLKAPTEIRGIDALLTGERARREGDPPLEVLQRVREGLEARKRARKGRRRQKLEYLDADGKERVAKTDGGGAAVFRLDSGEGSLDPAPERQGPGRETDFRKAVLAVMVCGHVASCDRAATLALAPPYLVHVARYRKEDELTEDAVRSERERCRRQFLKLRDPWVFRRAARLAGEIGLTLDLEP